MDDKRRILHSLQNLNYSLIFKTMKTNSIGGKNVNSHLKLNSVIIDRIIALI